MFLYNIHYDKNINAVNGEKIILPEGINTNSQIVLTADIEKNYDVYIDFGLPKSRKFRSERLELIGDKYYLSIPDIITVNTGNVDIQIIFVGADSIEKSIVNNNILIITPSINAIECTTDIDKTVLDSLLADNTQNQNTIAKHEAKLNEYQANLLALDTKIIGNKSLIDALSIDNESQNTTISECKTTIGEHERGISECKGRLDDHERKINNIQSTASTNKFTLEVVYDKSSTSTSINHGFPNGVFIKDMITNLNLSKYRFLIIDCQHDRNITMFMDLTERNYLNNFYINALAGIRETSETFATISFEVIVNLDKTSIKLNNTACSSSYSVTSELVNNKTMFISKVIGII